MMIDYKTARRAMIVPWTRWDANQIGVLTMIPSDPMYGGPLIQFAKGVIDPGESPLQAAIREGREELGVAETQYKFVYKLGEFRLTKAKYPVDVYAGEVEENIALHPHDYETKSVQWVGIDRFLEVGRVDQHEIATALQTFARQNENN
jgi:8-oxo-dGTP pyrophosphatase MutT (NUDIX family)